MAHYQELYHLNVTALDEAVSDWAETVNQLAELAEEADTGLLTKTRATTWAGVNADVTKPFVVTTAMQFAHAHEQAQAIHRVLSDLCDSHRSYRNQLLALEEEARTQGLFVQPNGMVIARPDGPYSTDYLQQSGTAWLNTAPQQAEQAREACDAMAARIRDILTQAAETDAIAERALNDLAGDNSQDDFAPPPVTSLDNAEYAQGLADAREALALINLGPDLTNGDLARLNELLHSQRHNEYFATYLTSRLGAEGTLQFWTDVLDERRMPSETAGDRAELLSDLGDGLGIVLGQATRSDDPALREWQQDMIALGNERIDTGDGTGPLGFQVMSSLMSSGEYGEQFLLDYGQALLDAERVMVPPGMGWGSSQTPYFSPDLFRADPMTGYAEALSRTPAAATTFFDDPDTVAHLLADRDYTHLPVEGGEHGGLAARAAIGDALFAATTGMNPHDPAATPVEHTDDHRRVLNDTVEVLARTGDDFPVEFREPMANILVNHGAGLHETASDLNDTAPFDRYQLFDVARQVSRDPDAYLTLNEGINYALVDSFHNPQTYDGEPLNPEDTLHRAGRTVGFLERARFEALTGEAQEELSNTLSNLRWERAALGAALKYVPFVGAGLTEGASLATAGFLRGEMARIEDGWTLETHGVSQLRDSQLSALAEAWYDVNGEWAENTPGYSPADGMHDEIFQSADLGNSRGQGESTFRE